MIHKPNFNKTAFLLAVFVFFAICSAASSAHAQSICLQQRQTQNFSYAADSAKAGFTLVDNVIVVEFKNTAANNNTYLTGIAFNTYEPLRLVNASTIPGWSAANVPGGGIGNYDLMAYGSGKTNRLSQNQWGTATFILSSTPQSVCISKTIVHLTGLPNSTSKPLGVPVASSPGGDDGTVLID